MAGATAERTTLGRVREAVFNETPTSPTFIQTRYTGESLDDAITTSQSEEITPDAVVSDLTTTDASVGGGIDFEFSALSYDDMLEAVVRGTWATVDIASAAGDISLVAAADDNVTSATAGKFTAVVVGQAIYIDGFSNPANNRLYRVRAKSVDNMTLTVFPAPAASQSAAGSDVSMTGDVLVNGVQQYSYAILKTFEDASPVARQIYNGMRVGGVSLDMSTGSYITGSWTFMGASADWIDAAPAGATFTPAPLTTPMNAVTNITDINQDGVGLCATGAVQQLTLEITQNMREQKGLCRLGAVGVASGQLNVNMTGSQYFENDVEAKKFKVGVESEFSFTLTDNDGLSYVFTLFRTKYSSYAANATGLGTDVVANVAFSALKDRETGHVIMINRIPAPASLLS